MSEDYVRQVRKVLGGAATPEEAEALADLGAALAEFRGEGHGSDDEAVRAEFGTPQQYAARLREALAPADVDPGEPAPAQGRVLGVPVDLRGPRSAAVRARVWNPADPAVWAPRLFGAGWTLNLGALAVRLRLIRPDDADAEVLEQIPPCVLRLAAAAPAAVTALGVGGVVALAGPVCPPTYRPPGPSPGASNAAVARRRRSPPPACSGSAPRRGRFAPRPAKTAS